MTDEAHQQDHTTMLRRKMADIFAAAVSDGCTARLGELSFPGRKTIDTPNYTSVTSRGVVPHLTPDNVRKYTPIRAEYMALEDFIEKKEPPIFKTPSSNRRPLHSFTATPHDIMTVLGPRRCPAVTAPAGNSAKYMAVFTSTGFYNLTVTDYARATKSLQPDVVVPMADQLHSSSKPNSKKLVRMVERTEEWLTDFFRQLDPADLASQETAVFAPVLPVEHPIQWDYLRHLAEDVSDAISGLAVYDVNLLPELTGYAPLAALPKMSLDPPKSPQEVLRQISLGIDICTLPFINTISDAGVALTFTFPAPAGAELQPLGVDMWSTDHSTSVKPLADGCECYACTKHHRAYMQHLLNAKEMLGWNLLQIHNHNIVSEFFRGIRATLSQGIDAFEQEARRFPEVYESDFPQGTGQRPRARGYHFKSEAAQEKINKSTWKDFDGDQDLGPAVEPSVVNGTLQQVVSDRVETPLQPDTDGESLAAKGFASTTK
ncbi:Queuine tRNA-ribosyltransferase accessory subunit [Paramyrothecium foliicola]|nr:Queuine tRNA-ribosyltransferase accessory subunit [Paramyrothecium foliicola]